ncbi:MAG: AbrB/MazE/SpoVT family DNA-binding domain-containing protein [Okeania sp. SIO3B3]|nr:AbrB/MazE/SpoVT family DNA-binding domain-containing protein [Okeania sp. SIO3B3]
MKIEKLGEKYQIVIPQEVREVLNLQPGDRLEIKVVNGTVVMTPATSKASRLLEKHRQLWQVENAVNYIRKQRESWRD